MPPPKRRGPGRSFRKVPPKGRKPMRRPYVKEWEPYEYGDGLFDEGAVEAFINDANPLNVPKNAYMAAVKSLSGSLQARYSPGRDINIETTAEEIEDLPGAQGAGINVNLSDWINDPAKALEGTTTDWWKSVINFDDFVENAEQKYLWTPLVKDDKLGGALAKLRLTKEDANGKQEGVLPLKISEENLSRTTSQIITHDAYKTLGDDVLSWGLNQAAHSKRIGEFEKLQQDILSILDTSLEDGSSGTWKVDLRATAAAITNPREKARAQAQAENFITSLEEYKKTNLTLRTVLDSESIGGDFSNPATITGKPDKTKEVDTTSFTYAPVGILPGQARLKTSREALSEEIGSLGTPYWMRVANTQGTQAVAVIGSQLAAAISPDAGVIAAAAVGLADNKVRKIFEKNIYLNNQEAKLQTYTDKAWNAAVAIDPSLLATAVPGAAPHIKLATGWASLINYREIQSNAADFLESLDQKSFYRTFVSTGRLIAKAPVLEKNFPGISNFVKYLTPADFAREGLKKINYFGLTDSFDAKGANLKSRPFAAASKLIADSPVLSKAVNIASFGLVDSTNFAYVRLRRWDPSGVGHWVHENNGKPFKIFATEFSSFMKGIPDLADSDWKVLSLINKAIETKNSAGHAILDDFKLTTLFQTGGLGAREKLLEELVSETHLNPVEVGRLFRRFPAYTPPSLISPVELKAALDHFAAVVPDFNPIFVKYGIYKPGTTDVDPEKLRQFFSQIGKAKFENKYIGIVSSVGKNLDRIQGALFAKLYKRFPVVENIVKLVRGSWLESAAADPRAFGIAAKAAFSKLGSKILVKLGIKGGLKAALKALGGVVLGGIEAVSNALPVIGPILAAVLAWISQKIISKVFNAVKDPAKAVGSFVYKLTPFSWGVFTDYGFYGSGEDIKVASCACCLGGCLLPLLAFGAMGVIGAANFNFKGGSTAGEGASQYVLVQMTVNPTTMDSILLAVKEADYTITVTNKGSSDLIGITIKDDYQAQNGVSFPNCSGGGVSNAGFVTWGVNSLAPGASVTYTCKMNVNESPARYVNATTTASGTISGAPAANNASAAIKIGSPVETAPCGWPGGQTTINADCAWHQGSEGMQAEDLAYGTGTAVVALISGTATRHVITTAVEVLLPYGIYVDVVSPGGYKTRYAHLDPEAGDTVGSGKFPGDLVKTWQVNKGDTIGHTDDTGHSTGPHLHYEIYDNSGVNVCPATYLDQSAPACH